MRRKREWISAQSRLIVHQWKYQDTVRQYSADQFWHKEKKYRETVNNHLSSDLLIFQDVVHKRTALPYTFNTYSGADTLKRCIVPALPSELIP